MTIDEAITHAREVAERKRRAINFESEDNIDDDIKMNCLKCAEEHEQLAEWLEELKELRNMTAGHLYAVAFKNGYLKAEKEVRDKSIDDLIAKCENAKFAESDEIALSDIHTGVNSGLSMAIHFAEQLKVGGENG